MSACAFGRYGTYEQTIEHWLHNPVVTTFVAMKAHRLIGFIMIHPVFPLEEDILEILAIAVEPGEKRSGVGTLLLKSAEEYGTGNNASIMILHTGLDNIAARDFFSKFGFIQIDHKKNYYPAGQDAFMMAKTI